MYMCVCECHTYLHIGAQGVPLQPRCCTQAMWKNSVQQVTWTDHIIISMVAKNAYSC